MSRHPRVGCLDEYPAMSIRRLGVLPIEVVDVR
jgi:hypothetical protein